MKKKILLSLGVFAFVLLVAKSALAGCGCGGCNGNCGQGGCGPNCAVQKDVRMCPAHDLVMARADVAKVGSTKAVNVGNKVCPVMGEEIDEKTKVTYEYNGKVYNFCCPSCIEEFKKNPDKYIKIIAQTS